MNLCQVHLFIINIVPRAFSLPALKDSVRISLFFKLETANAPKLRLVYANSNNYFISIKCLPKGTFELCCVHRAQLIIQMAFAHYHLPCNYFPMPFGILQMVIKNK